MFRTIIILPDGTEIASGVPGTNAIRSVTITEMVNDSQDLRLGSTCAAMAEVKLFTPAGALPIAAGDEITVYRENENGLRYKIGIFVTEKPTHPSANTMSITAYDRISRLDKDLTLWLESLDSWPYELFTFANMVCNACGLTLKNSEIPNGAYLVRKFSADGITGRKLIQWVGEISGRFCRATADGLIEFAWYQEVPSGQILPTAQKNSTVSFADDGNGNITITADDTTVEDDGEGNVVVTSSSLGITDDKNGAVKIHSIESLFYYMNSLSFQDYTVAPIEKIQLRQNDEDVGTIYPDTAEALNTYSITGNYLITNSSGEELIPVAKVLYEALQGISYTPCRVTVPANMNIRAGSIVNVRDQNGKAFTTFVMVRRTVGQRDTLECTGSPSRNSSTAVNNQNFKAFYGKVLNLRTDVDGIKAENKDTQGRVASINLDVEVIKSQVSLQQTETEGLRQKVTTIEQNAQSVSIKVQDILENGTDKVKTGMGYTFDDDGIHIEREGSEIENKLDHTGMYVTKSGGNVLQATSDGVKAIDITVKNYLVVGPHARFEKYAGNRTACFYLEGD